MNTLPENRRRLRNDKSLPDGGLKDQLFIQDRRILQGESCKITRSAPEKFKAEIQTKVEASAKEPKVKEPALTPVKLRKVVGNVLAGAIPFVGIALDIGFTIDAVINADRRFNEQSKKSMTEWDPIRSVFLKTKLNLLPSKPSLWSSQSDWTAEQQKSAASNIISFSGGGSQVKMEVSDEFTGEKGMTTSQILKGSLVLKLGTSLTLGEFNLQDNGTNWI